MMDWTCQACWTLISQCRCDWWDGWVFTSRCVSVPVCWLGTSRINLRISLVKVLFYLLQTLDTRDLKIVSVSANGQAAQFTMGPKHSFKGMPLDVTLPFDLSRWPLLLSSWYVLSKQNAANVFVLWTNQRAACDRGGDLWDISISVSSAVAHTWTDRWEETSVPVQPVSGESVFCPRTSLSQDPNCPRSELSQDLSVPCSKLSQVQCVSGPLLDRGCVLDSV